MSAWCTAVVNKIKQMMGIIIKRIKANKQKKGTISCHSIDLSRIPLAVLILSFWMCCNRTWRSGEKGSKDTQRYEMPLI